ncbi:SDR family NAD(P)-dependent oxidoreductase [Paenarthrobacter sp. S56]|uniref:SDR family NAD(P)-dependent oxidoreductase n=1 Tax=Paenarthrobacter sp. S56 TaxID=3138179 RepID=UPI00321B9A17
MSTTAFDDASSVPVANLLSLKGRRAVVTGGGQGLGKAIALRLAEAEAEVLIGDLDRERARQAAADVGDRYSVGVLGFQMDVSDSHSVSRAAAVAVAEFGGIDIWVNNAGIFPSVPVLETPDQTWDDVFAVNARGVFNGSREAARHMNAQGNGGSDHQHRLHRRLHWNSTGTVCLCGVQARSPRHDQTNGP